jgi:dTDP-4-amino-4,6-dideoxygalactose transaminase
VTNLIDAPSADSRRAQHGAGMVRVPLLVPHLPSLDQLAPYLATIDRNRWYSNFGPLVESLEARLASTFDSLPSPRINIVTVSNATAGLELALRALNLPVNSFVLVPAFTFVATATAVLSAGLSPIAADVDPVTWQLTPEIALDAVGRADIRAVIPVCVFGRDQPASEWTTFQNRTGIPVVIDAAAAFGNQQDPGPTCAVFSMHATKPLSSGEGGFIVTRSREMAEAVRQLSNFGINLTRPEISAIGTSTMIGVNAKLSEYHAAVGHASLDAWPENAKRRRDLYTSYAGSLRRVCGDEIVWQDADPQTIRSVCAFLMPSRRLRDRAEAVFSQAGIATRRWYCPTVDQHPAFAHIDHLPTLGAHDIGDRLLGIPFHVGLDRDACALVVAALAQSFKLS